MNEKTQYVRVNRYTRPGSPNYGVNGVVWHYTASPGATAQNIRDYFDGTCVVQRRSASAHDTIDNKEVIHMIPHNEVAFHAHDRNRCMVAKFDPNANYTSLGVELCIDRHGNLEPATYANAVDYGAELCKKYNLNPLVDFFRHYDVTRKNCPAFWVSDPKGFEQFKQDVANKLNGDDLTMSQYQELKQEIADLKSIISKLVENDSPADTYALEPLKWAKENKISTGERPQGLTKREETATMIWNYHNKFGCCQTEVK